MWTHPYHNDRIIMVIQEMFFSSGTMLFAARFNKLFTRQDAHSQITHQVPLPMVCLVLTGVSYKSNVFVNLMPKWVFFYSYMLLFMSGKWVNNAQSSLVPTCSTTSIQGM